MQSEGASPRDDWWAWERAGRAPESGHGNGFRDRYSADFRALQGLGITDHRISLPWARIEPSPGEIDHAEVDHYRAVLDAGRAAGLRIWVCLLHTALPRWFADRGGFAADDAEAVWLAWVDRAVTLFGDLAGGWMPINNPTSLVKKGYLDGTFPPGEVDSPRAAAVLHTVHRCDLLAAQRIRAASTAPTCSNESLMPLYPADPGAPVDGYRTLIWEPWASLAREHPDAWSYIGFSYYYAGGVTATGALVAWPPDAAPGPLGYVPWADGLADVLRELQETLPGQRFVLAELGHGGADQDRVAYLRAARAAIEASGVPLHGVHLWTDVDNYEWRHGFAVNFGLHDLDRNPRPSAALIAAWARE